MHTSRRNSIIHVLCWAAVICFPMLFYITGENWGVRALRFVKSLGSPLSYLLVFYVNYLWLVPRLFFKKRYQAFFGLNVLLIGAGLVVMMGWFQIMTVMLPTIHNAAPQGAPPHMPHRLAMMMFHAILMLMLIVALSIAVRMAQRWRELEEAHKEAERFRAEAQLSSLRNQLNPHFLLNTLNNIYALIAFNPLKAQEAVAQLSKLLRHLLYDNKQNFVPLYQEVAFINNFIELMKIRMTDQIEITTRIHIAPDDATPIAPLIFISLIENAFKHGVAQDGTGQITITLTNDNGLITCDIRNTNNPKGGNDKSGSGIGMEQVSQRLALIYPGKHTWEKGVTPDGKFYFSTLPLNSHDS